MLDLYKNIKEQRLKMNWSQQQLAEMIGYKDRTSIAKIESGAFDLSESKISAFAKVFGISPVELMGLNDEYVGFKESESGLTSEEMNVIYKYRKLDLHGKKMVDFTLENEYQRSTKQDNVTDFKASNKEYLKPVAAHERTDIEVTDEMRKHDDGIMDDDNF